jgi:hypothetical protein
MRKSITSIFVFIIIIAIIFLFAPKTKTTGGLKIMIQEDSIPDPRCFGIMTKRDVPDATLWTCYGVFY